MTRHLKPTAAMGVFIALLLLLGTTASAVGLYHPLLLLNESQILYLFSTSAQVLAGIYGLTITGFIFFRNELIREVFEDETLTDAVDALKQRDFSLLLFVTVLVIATLLLANAAIANEAYGSVWLSNVIFNVGQSAFVTSLLAIAWFIFDVIAPQRVQLASQNLQDRLDPNRTVALKGSLEEFLKNYNQIETLLSQAGRVYRELIVRAQDNRLARHLSNSRLVEILYRNKLINPVLLQRLRDLISLRNSIIHGAEPMVSEDMIRASAQSLQELQQALTQNSDRSER